MMKYTEVGLAISGDEILTEHGKVAMAMMDEIQRLHKELKWWRDYAFQMISPPTDEDWF
jgi:hypothetical protein